VAFEQARRQDLAIGKDLGFLPCKIVHARHGSHLAVYSKISSVYSMFFKIALRFSTKEMLWKQAGTRSELGICFLD
jgi:hypothetical protein